MKKPNVFKLSIRKDETNDNGAIYYPPLHQQTQHYNHPKGKEVV